MEKISAVIAAYNEEDYILQTLETLKEIDEIDEIIVVDDGSTDNTFAVLTFIRDIKLLSHGTNRGKGEAVKSGLRFVNNNYVLLIDADVRSTAAEVKKMISCLDVNKMVIGVLPKASKKNGFGITKTIANKGIRLLTKHNVSSVLSGQRVVPVGFLRNMDLPSDFSLEFKLTLEAVRAGMEIVEVAVHMEHREYGRTLSGFLHRGRQCREIFHQIVKEVVNVKIHNRFFH